MRKLVKTLLSLSLMAPAAALALGLGDVKLHSALNQRLDADIELLSVNPAEVDEIDVSLASAETFSKIGLDRPAVLMFVNFDVQQRENGDYYVKATSKEIIREPFLDFLIEVKWPSGRVLREYTLLLDPPVSHKEAAPVVSKPGTAPAQSGGQPTPAPSAPAASTTQSAPATTYYPRPAQEPMSREGIVYGPVKANETLWRIAQKVRPNKDVSVQQVMIALLKANPYAFFDNNINRLKKGYVLRIDDPALLTAMNKAEAAREVSRQTRAWQDYRAAVAEKAAERMPAEAGDAPAASSASAKGEPKLKLVAPEGESAQAGGGADTDAAEGDMNEQLMLALESSAAQRKENEELQGRVEGLEEQLQDMQRLLALKDADLAALQKQLREGGEAVTLPSEKAEKMSEPAEKMAEGEEKPAEKPAADESKTPQGAEPASGEKAMPAEAEGEMAKPSEAKPAADAAKAEPKKPEPAKKPAPKPKPKIQPQPAPQPSFIESMLQDPLMLGAGGGTLVLLLVLAIVMIRRRRKGGFQESILSGGTSSMLSTKGDESTGETSFLSDLAISGMGGGAITTDEGEVDPLTEADVFMAYGRNQQAEEVLKKALESNPKRPDVLAKLLEVYYTDKNREQFEALANESASALQGSEEHWSKVAAMGHELCPDNELFAGAEGGEAPAPKEPAAKPESMTDEVLDIGLDLDELTAEMESEVSEDSLDLGLDLDSDEEKKPEAETTPAEDDLSDMDFDLDLGGEDSAAPAEDDLSGMDFDLGDSAVEEEKPAEEAAAPAESDDLGDLDFDLGEMASESEEAPTESAPSAEESADTDLSDFDFGDLDLEGGTEEAAVEEAPAAEPSADEDFGSLDLGDLESDAGSDLDDFGDLGDLDDDSMLDEGDEITTKLDLAQAYIEMGDNEGARSMLEEVVEGGNDEQKQQAQDLLGKI